MDPTDELVDIVDERNDVVGVVPAGRSTENLLHRCTYVFVLNPRASCTSIGGPRPRTSTPSTTAVRGALETPRAPTRSARRELEEELGVAAEPTFRFLHRYDGPSGRVWGAAFDVVWDGPIVWQPAEVVWGAVPLDEVGPMTERERFCPDGLEVFERWRSSRSGRQAHDRS